MHLSCSLLRFLGIFECITCLCIYLWDWEFPLYIPLLLSSSISLPIDSYVHDNFALNYQYWFRVSSLDQHDFQDFVELSHLFCLNFILQEIKVSKAGFKRFLGSSAIALNRNPRGSEVPTFFQSLILTGFLGLDELKFKVSFFWENILNSSLASLAQKNESSKQVFFQKISIFPRLP